MAPGDEWGGWHIDTRKLSSSSDGYNIFLNDLVDVIISSPEDGNLLQYNSVENFWGNTSSIDCGIW
jgi:hypothetical protein